jgi:hypothetical protein
MGSRKQFMDEVDGNDCQGSEPAEFIDEHEFFFV